MAEILVCPASNQLAKIALGHLPEANVAALIEHITNCSNCVTRLGSMTAEDSLVDAVRFKDQTQVRPDQEVVRRLLEKVRGLIAETKGKLADQTRDLSDPISNEDTPNFSWVDAPDQPTQEDDGLAPPKGPDELGWLGPYRVLRVLGEGGMGKVFLAEDPALQRSVALKVMKPSLARNSNSRKRFLQEARAAAAIEHDNIIPIYQVSEDRGVPFVAMPLLKGTSLEDLLRRVGALRLPQTLRIGSQIAEGLSAAHERQLIHRDIKPGNIWIEPTAGGRVKILDFGLARTTVGETGLTQSGAILGTPAYMPPEQARGEKVDHRADLYSLGCVLYRMATGEMPHKGDDTMAMLLAIALQEPTAPKLVKPELPQALSDLIMKLLAKDPANRFDSARAVVAALKAIESGGVSSDKSKTAILTPSMLVPSADLPMARELSTERTERDVSGPVAAAIPLAARAAPLKRRRPILLLACAAAAALLLVVSAGVVIYRFSFQTPEGTLLVEVADEQAEVAFKKGKLEIRDPKTRELLYTIGASEKNKKLPPGEYLIDVKGAGGLELSTDRFSIKKDGEEIVTVRIARPILAQKGPESDPLNGKTSTYPFETLDHLDAAKIPPEERLDWQPKELVAVIGDSRGRHICHLIDSLDYSPDGKIITCTCTCAGGGRAALFDAETLRLKSILPGIAHVAYASDHKIMVTTTNEELWLADANRTVPKQRVRFGDYGNALMALSSDGKTLMEGGGREIRLWDLSGEKPKLRSEIKDLKYQISNCTLAPDGKMLVVSAWNEDKVFLWDLTGEQLKERGTLPSVPRASAAFSPDSKTLVIPGNSNDTHVWDLRGDKPQKKATIPNGQRALVFSRDGKKLAMATSNGWDSGVCVYDMTGAEPTLARKFALPLVSCVAFSPNGNTLATGTELGILQVWDITGEEPKERFPLEGHTQMLDGALVSPDGKTMVTHSRDCLRIWNMTSPVPRLRRQRKEQQKQYLSAAFSPDSKTLACGVGTDVQLWDLTADEPDIRTIFTPDKAGWSIRVAFAPDGKTLAIESRTEKELKIRLWDASSAAPKEKAVLEKSTGPFVFGRDGTRLVCFGAPKDGALDSIKTWDLSGTEPHMVVESIDPRGGIFFHQYTFGLSLSPDGKTAFTFGNGGLNSWSISGPKLIERDKFEEYPFWRDAGGSLACAPDGKILACAKAYPGDVSLWDTKNVKRLLKWNLPEVVTVSFAPDGRHLITANRNGTAYILRLEAPSPARLP